MEFFYLDREIFNERNIERNDGVTEVQLIRVFWGKTLCHWVSDRLRIQGT
jgi:hypothetical protein